MTGKKGIERDQKKRAGDTKRSLEGGCRVWGGYLGLDSKGVLHTGKAAVNDVSKRPDNGGRPSGILVKGEGQMEGH